MKCTILVELLLLTTCLPCTAAQDEAEFAEALRDATSFEQTVEGQTLVLSGAELRIEAEHRTVAVFLNDEARKSFADFIEEV